MDGLSKTLAPAGVADIGKGLSGTADFYAGLLLPDGRAAFFTTTAVTPTSGWTFGTIADVKSYRPVATGVPLGAPFSANVSSLFAYQRVAGDPTGGLAVFVLAVKAGALADWNDLADFEKVPDRLMRHVYAQGHAMLGQALLVQGQWGPARDSLSRALVLYPARSRQHADCAEKVAWVIGRARTFACVTRLGLPIVTCTAAPVGAPAI